MGPIDALFEQLPSFNGAIVFQKKLKYCQKKTLGHILVSFQIIVIKDPMIPLIKPFMEITFRTHEKQISFTMDSKTSQTSHICVQSLQWAHCSK
jgi:hypothetical protein